MIIWKRELGFQIDDKISKSTKLSAYDQISDDEKFKVTEDWKAELILNIKDINKKENFIDTKKIRAEHEIINPYLKNQLESLDKLALMDLNK